MENFIKEIWGKNLLITVDNGNDLVLSCVANVQHITRENFMIGTDNFQLMIDNLSTFTQEDDTWIVKTPKNIRLIITILDKIRQ